VNRVKLGKLFEIRSLRRRLVFKVAGFVALAMAVITLAVVYVMSHELTRQAHLMLAESARSSQIQLENRIAYLVEATRRLADNPFMINGLIDARAREEDLPKLVRNFAEGTSMSTFDLLDYDGAPVYQAQTWRPEFNHSPELRAALAMGNTALYTDAASRQLLIIAPISYYDTTQGALVVGFDLARLVSSHALRDESSSLSILVAGVQLLEINHNDEVDYFRLRVRPDERAPLLTQLELEIEAGVPKSQLDSVVMETLSRFVGISLVLTLASAMVAAGIGKGIARPVLELCERVRDDAEPKCSPLGTGDELELLAGAFDQRTAALRSARFELEQQRDRFRYEANHDTLTGLPNRANFEHRLQERIAGSGESSPGFCVVFIDLDRFKLINDSLGHPTGDLVLRIVAQRLLLEIGEEDDLFRHGGDEFILITAGGAQNLAKRFVGTLSQPVRMGEHDLDVSASIGITAFPRDGRDVETLVRNADIAMYRAKNAGGGQYRHYDTQMGEVAFARMETEAGLRRALEREELVVHYQPQIDMRGNSLIGSEALVRWQHPERGLVMPGAFIPVAEESRLIVDIGRYVLREACSQQAQWYRQGYNPGRVSVNLAGPQILDPELVDDVEEILMQTGCRPQWLELEVTESFIMRDPAGTITTLKRLRAMGISLAIDDFGTGYSSLAYLKRLPITRLKIDQSFVRNAVMDPDDVAIIEAIAALAAKLKLDLIAEGVETDSQKALLLQYGCDKAQGYLFSRPVAAVEFDKLLKSMLNSSRQA